MKKFPRCWLAQKMQKTEKKAGANSKKIPKNYGKKYK